MRRALARTIGREIRVRRQSQAMLQSELGAKVGVTREFISMLERGQRVPSIEMLLAIGKVLGTTGWWILKAAAEQRMAVREAKGYGNEGSSTRGTKRTVS